MINFRPGMGARGYAAQWIALGALVLFGWIGFGVNRAGINRAKKPRR